MEKKYIFPDNINKLKDLDFISLQLSIEVTNEVKIQSIISKFNECNLKSTHEKYLISYHYMDFIILLFVNIIG